MTPTEQKFIVVDQPQYLEPTEKYIPQCVLVTSYTWYSENFNDIEAWLKKYRCLMPGMIIKFPSKGVLTLFLLKWQ